MARGISISVAPQFYVLLAGMCVLIPLPWVMGWILAAMLHELFHCLAIWLCGMKISYLHIGPDGAKIGAGDLSGSQSVLCALAGPFGGLFTACVGGLFPQLSICAAVQSMYNLLPVYPLDGGRALLGISHLLLSKSTADILCRTVEMLTFTVLFLLALIAGFVWNFGCLPVFLIAAFIIKMRIIKRPCK